MRSWPDGMRLAGQMQFRFPQFVPTALAQLIPNASPEGLVMMQDLMKYDPQQRPTASQTLQYPFFQARNISLIVLFFDDLLNPRNLLKKKFNFFMTNLIFFF